MAGGWKPSGKIKLIPSCCVRNTTGDITLQVILFDIGSASHKMQEMKQELFEKAGIGIPHEDIETNDVAIFG